MKHIIVPLDFSTTSMHAAYFAALIADKMDAAICLVHVLAPWHETIYQPFPLHDKFDELVVDDRKEQLENCKAKLLQRNNLLHIQTHLLTGEVADSILSFITEQNASLIIVGTTGSGMAKKRLFGSVNEKLIRECKKPVIAVPEKAKMQFPDAIVFATSHFEKDERLLKPVIKMARLFQAIVHVVYYLEADWENVPTYIDQSANMDAYHKFLKDKYPDVFFKCKIIDGNKLNSALEKYEEQYGADILVLVPYATNFFEKLKSATSKLAYQSCIPVLILHKDESSHETNEVNTNKAIY